MLKRHEKNSLEPVERAPVEIWLFNRRMTISDLARAIGVSQGVLARNVAPQGHKDFRPASVATRLKVKAFTDGAITLDDWPENPLPRQETGFPSPDAPVPSAVIANTADGTFSHERAA